MLLPENIWYLFWKSKNVYRSLNAVYGFSGNHDLDEVIQFWLDYWKSQGLPMPELDPLLVKVIIGIESSFNPKARTKVPGSSATGLMQLTDQTRGVLSGRPDKTGYREVKNHYMNLSKKDIEDPVINIAAGTRWLAHKYSKIPKQAEKTVYNTVKNYHSWDDQGESYATKVFDLYNKSK